MNDTINRWAGELDYPMFIVTAASDDERAGCLVGFVTQCSENRFAGRVLERVDAEDHQALLLEPFAAESGPDLSRFRFHRAKRLELGPEA